MAAIQIKASDVISACNKVLESCEKDKDHIDKTPMKPERMNALRHSQVGAREDAVNRVKKLAEYAMSYKCYVCGENMTFIGIENNLGDQRYSCENCERDRVISTRPVFCDPITKLPTSSEDMTTTITIDQNDFELIGEFL